MIFLFTFINFIRMCMFRIYWLWRSDLFVMFNILLFYIGQAEIKYTISRAFFPSVKLHDKVFHIVAWTFCTSLSTLSGCKHLSFVGFEILILIWCPEILCIKENDSSIAFCFLLMFYIVKPEMKSIDPFFFPCSKKF